jgi:hypothetical protein
MRCFATRILPAFATYVVAGEAVGLVNDDRSILSGRLARDAHAEEGGDSAVSVVEVLELREGL